ncbi:MAG TPA: hypothetical protein VHE35_25970 [Kofleriaceae bacterium]|nr:hypothetical protein [Kofleriaceae bacterium]
MMASTGATAQQLLDRVQRLAQLDELDLDGYADQLRAELDELPATTLAELEARDDRLRALLSSFDAFASKAMRIRLEHLAVDWPALTPPFRTLLSTTVSSYVNGLDRLRERVAGSVARHDPHGALAVAAVVVEAAERSLAVRGALGDLVLGIAGELARASWTLADARARDRSLDDSTRLKWTALRKDLEKLMEHPLRLAEHRFAERQKELLAGDLVLDEIPEPSFAELIEPYDTPVRS